VPERLRKRRKSLIADRLVSHRTRLRLLAA
jgi:hypothetical protein